MHPKLFGALVLGIVGVATSLSAQPRMIRVTSPDGKPVAYALVSLAKETPRVTDENGLVPFPNLPNKAMNVDVRRLGFTSFSGPLEASDASILTVAIAPVKSQAGQFDVEPGAGPLSLEGFYKRLLKQQNSNGSGFFFAPEEIDRRNPSDLGVLIRDLSGVRLERATDGGFVATSSGGGGCQIPLMLDGQIVRVPGESSGALRAPSLPEDKPKAVAADDAARMGMEIGTTSGFQRKAAGFADSNSVKIDQLSAMPTVHAVEAYPRGMSLPAELSRVDKACGLIVIWLGARK